MNIELWAVLWNKNQKAEHLETLDSYLADCRGKAERGEGQEWMLVYVSSDESDASNMCDRLARRYARIP